ncbi:MAG TPA: M23 family metallopeptidase [Gemmatimonadales bacterium]|nr:M23 family metallopeptidase [Gemmatimonadales bacterium]
MPQVTLTTEPAMLQEGTVGWLRVGTREGVVVSGGEVAGEPLHFEPFRDSTFRGLVAVPVEAPDSLVVSLFLERPGRSDTLPIFVPVRRAGYSSEMLSVPPAYARPDSAATVRIQSEIERSRQVSRSSQGKPRIWRGAFRLPRPSRITSRFGTARVYNGEVQSRHLGTDFAGVTGAPVRAAGRGVVALVADFYLAGHAVYIDHGAGLVTGYFHLSRVDVRQGDTVLAGQRIGAVGRSGRVTGPHLHWVARYGAISVDPMSLLELGRTSPGHGTSGESKRADGR